MSLNKDFNLKLNQSTTNLIGSLTSFREGSVNHSSCLDYAVNNFHYHRYLDCDDNKLEKSIKGISDKFFIHSQPMKAKALTKNYDIFINNTISENIYQRSQTHYKMIAILLQLSTTPLQKDYELRIKPKKQMAKDSFNWGAYLLDGEDRFDPEDWSISSDEEFGDELELTSTPNNQSPEKWKPDNNKAIDRFNKHLFQPRIEQSEFNIYPLYWMDRCYDYDHVQSLNNAFKFQTLKETLSDIKEINVCREAIWLLCGQENLFVFVEKDGNIKVSEDFAITHITNRSLMNMMTEFAECGNSVRKLQKFACKGQSTMTYQAFATSLSKYLKEMQLDLYREEQLLMEQSETYLVSDLRKKLSNYLTLIALLSKIFDVSIALDQNTDSNAVKASRLLGVLYNSLLDESNLTCIEATHKLHPGAVLFLIFIDVMRPYIDIIDGWISSGELHDFHQEFVIALCVKSEKQNVQSDNFWHNSVQLNLPNVSSKLPWLSPLLNKIIVSGKSTEILQAMNVVTKSQKKTPPILEEKENDFVIFDRFRHLVCADINSKYEQSTANVKSLSAQVKNEKNLLLNSNFTNLFFDDTSKPLGKLLNKTRSLEENSSVSHLFYTTLNSILDLKCERTNKQLLYAFKNQFNLTQTLDIFCNLYLMGKGDVMHYFCVGIFEKLALGGTVELDQVALNVLMQDSIGQYCKPIDIFVCNSVTSEQPDREFNNLNITDTIQLHHTVQWPLNLVFTDKCIAVYSQVFTYLVKVKRALHAVESLNYSELGSVAQYSKKYRENDTGKIEKWNRLLLIRCRILYFLKHWYSFIMVSVIQTEKLKLLGSISNAKSLDDILKAHEEFLNQIFSKCMFSNADKVSKLVQGTITKVMKLSLWFNKLWLRGIDNITLQNLKEVENSFHESNDFLVNILKPISARGAIPLLDSLAVAFLK